MPGSSSLTITCKSAEPGWIGKKGIHLDWHYAQSEPTEQLAQLHFFSMKKIDQGREIEFRITIAEYAIVPKGHHGRFFAQADKQVNQKTAGFIPSGWGDSVLKALSDCLRLIREFPYEGEA